MAVTPPWSPTSADFSDMKRDVSVVETEYVEGTVRLFDNQGRVRNIPIPSDDPADPLTWSLWQRCVILASLCIFGIAGFGVVQSTPLFFSEIIGEYKKETRGAFNAPSITQLASYPSLCMGVGNFLFVPLSMMLGRRAVFLLNNILMLAAIIWSAKSNSFTSHLASRCLQGLSCGISDCLLPIMILDITFLHRRGLWMSFYWACTAAGSTALLVVVPFVVQNTGANWRTNYWFWSGFSALSLLLAIFALPETLFARPPAMIDGNLVSSDQYGNVTITAAEGLRDTIQHQQASRAHDVRPAATYLRALKPWKYQDGGFKTFLRTYVDMSLSLLNPAIFWVLIVNSLLFAGLVCQSLTYSQVLESPPWLFSSEMVGTAQVGSTVGALFALGLSGATVDRISGYITRRNGGIREPEHVLPNFIVPSCLCFAGMVLYGVVAGNSTRYPGGGWVGVHIGFGLYYCGFVAMSAITGVWIGESTPHSSGAGLVLVCGGRNALSFAISNNFTSWIASQGFQNAYIELGGILLAVTVVGGIPLFFGNKHIRRVWTKKLRY